MAGTFLKCPLHKGIEQVPRTLKIISVGKQKQQHKAENLLNKALRKCCEHPHGTRNMHVNSVNTVASIHLQTNH